MNQAQTGTISFALRKALAEFTSFFVLLMLIGLGILLLQKAITRSGTGGEITRQ
jgi:hypothetical protein